MSALVRIRRRGRLAYLAAAAASVAAASFCGWPVSFSVVAPPQRPAPEAKPSAEARPEAEMGMEEEEEYDALRRFLPRGETVLMGLSGKLASNFSVQARELGIPEDEREEWLREQVTKRQTAHLHRHLACMQDEGLIAPGRIDYHKVLWAATSLPWSETYEVLHLMPKPETDDERVSDPTGDICAAFRRAARWPRFYLEYPRTGREEARVQQRVEELCEQTTNRFFPDRPIDYTKVGKAAVNVPILRIVRAFELVKQRKETQDPTAFLVAEIRPDRINHDTLGPIATEPSKLIGIRKRIWWLNNVGGFEGALDANEIEMAASGVGASGRVVQMAINTLQLVKESEGEIRDPTKFVISGMTKRVQKYKDLEAEVGQGESDIAERSARFEAVSAPLRGASDASKELSRKDAGEESSMLDSDEDNAGGD